MGSTLNDSVPVVPEYGPGLSFLFSLLLLGEGGVLNIPVNSDAYNLQALVRFNKLLWGLSKA